jgi:glycosyltransferase involved in cell wall biosynthesis
LKIAFFHHTLRLGSGIDTVIYELANRLQKKGVDTTVFCFQTNYTEEECKFKLEKIKSPFADTTTKMTILAPFILDKTRILNSSLRNFDIINTHMFPANYIVRNLKGPLNIVTEWSIWKPKWASSIKMKLYARWLAPYGNKAAAKKADVVLASSEFIKNWILENYSINPVVMSLDGINFDLLDKSKVSSEKVFRLYPRIEGKKIILYVGRITDHKNIHSLIEAFSTLKKKIPDVILLLVGDYDNYASYYSILLKLIKTKNLQDDVIFAGVVPWKDLPSYYAACTIYATCSVWEGFLRPEAYAFGKPIVCFNISSLPETVSNGKTGFLVEDLDVTKFAERMYDLLSNEQLAQEMGENGYRWAKDNLDFDIISERFRLFCRDLIDKSTK